MRKVLLTSAGFANKRVEDVFIRLVDKDPRQLRALFIPTAANNADAIAVLPECMNDLLNLGIPSQNITVFDLHRTVSYEELSEFDVVYLTGGSPEYLLSRIMDTHFHVPLAKFIDNRGIYIGVSAGSIVATNNLPNSLNYINCTLSVHRQAGTKSGPIDTAKNPHIDLTDNTAILIYGDTYQVVE